METVLFYLFGGIALISAILVVANRRVFYSALSLILCLCSVAVLYLILKSPFIAAVQIIVYAGAIMVVFLFVIMLLDPFSSAIIRGKKASLAYIGVLLGILTVTFLYPILKSYDLAQTPKNPSFIDGGVGSVKQLGHVLFSEYLLPFEMTSVLILIAIIGVVVLAKRQASK
ncbi:MAG: NADH-quinone oxidoreductase subunit J [Acidobacteria bacterium]|nr:NADH-quinone oxidoreductase subunit J [Acidobacteriota bacterium]